MRGRDGPPDKRLFRRARQGDRQAFLLLLRRYDTRLRRLVLRLVAEPERVDAILRRAYVKAWRSLAVVELPGTVAEWLYRVVYNACVNELRWAPQRPPPEPVQGPRVPLPVASAERRLAGLRALTPEERIPLALVDGEGFSLEAAARILQRPPVAVAADLSRARGRWRSFVMGDGVAAGAPEAVELEPDEVAVQAQAEADGIGPVDPDVVAGDGQPRHVRVVATSDGNGQASTSRLDTAEDALGADPAPDAQPGDITGNGSTDTSEDDVTDDAVGPPDNSTTTATGSTEDAAADGARTAPGNGSSSSGAGARRKRRRDAKREVRNRAQSQSSNVEGSVPDKSEGPRDAAASHDDGKADA